MTVSYAEYLDNTNGLNPSIGAESFNNIVYSARLCLGKQIQGTIDRHDLKLLKSHIKLNLNEYGLYKPKHSNDNTTSMILGLHILLDNGDEEAQQILDNMSFFHAVKGANFHPKDVIFYGYELLHGPAKTLCKALMGLEAVIHLVSCLRKYKRRPKWGLEKIKFLLDRKKKLVNTVYSNTGYGRDDYYELSDGSTYVDRFQLNSGKFLTMKKIYVAQKHSPFMRFIGKICEKILKKSIREEYMKEMNREYFRVEEHPCIEANIGVTSVL